MRVQYKLLQEVYKQILENGSSADVESIKNRMIAGEDVVGQLNKTLPVIAIFHLDYGGEYADIEGFGLPNMENSAPERTVLPPTAIPIYESAWYDPYQKKPNYSNVFLKIYITNTSKEAIDFVNAQTNLYFDYEVANRCFKYMQNIYKVLGINDNSDPILPPKNWLTNARKRYQALNKDNPGIEMDI